MPQWAHEENQRVTRVTFQIRDKKWQETQSWTEAVLWEQQWFHGRQGCRWLVEYHGIHRNCNAVSICLWLARRTMRLGAVNSNTAGHLGSPCQALSCVVPIQCFCDGVQVMLCWAVRWKGNWVSVSVYVKIDLVWYRCPGDIVKEVLHGWLDC